jgi:hypothetical protein
MKARKRRALQVFGILYVAVSIVALTSDDPEVRRIALTLLGGFLLP